MNLLIDEGCPINSIMSFLFDLLIIPGGFAFGDRYYEYATDKYFNDPGKMCIEAPVTKIIMETNKKNIPITLAKTL